MFKIFPGFHLLEAYHKNRHAQKYHPSAWTKKLLKLAFVLIVTNEDEDITGIFDVK